MRKSLFWGTLAFMAVWAQAQPYATWNRFRTLTVNTSTSGGLNVAGTVSNFPLLVRLTNVSTATGANVLAEALAGGADLRFTDSSGLNALSYQIETWNSARAAIWVKVPTITGNASTQIRMYWGKAGSTTASSASAVFDTASGYTGVWHLNEGSGAATVSDATVNALNYAGDPGVVSVPGVAGDARYYNQGTAGGDTYFIDEAPSNAKYVAAGASSRITISAWVNRRGAGSSGSQGIFSNFRYGAGNNRSYALMRDVTGNFNVLTSVDGAADSRRVSTTTTFPDNAWQHVVTTINPAGATAPVIRIWVNGVSQPLSGTNSSAAAAAVFAATSADAKPLIGALERSYQQMVESFIDELQLTNGTIRDSNWIKLSYETQRPDTSKVILGSVQSVTSRPLFYPQKAAAYMINAAISPNEPVISGPATLWGITPSTLPTGLSFSTTTGIISGTPTVGTSATQFIVNATIGGNVVRDTLSIAVTLGTPPNAPTGVSAVRGNKQAALTWVAPIVVGSSVISGYKAMAVSDTTKSCSTTGALNCTVTGLTNGTAYTFVVKASNSAGSSAASTASSAVTPAGRPGMPTNLTVTAGPSSGATGSALVAWSAPTSDSGSIVLEYYANSKPAGGFCYIAVPAPTSCTMSGLTIGTNYTIGVYAVNSAGYSDTASKTVTPVSIRLPGSQVIRVTGASRPFTFVLPEEALATTEKVTVSIADVWGRTVWSKGFNPKESQIKEVTWNGKSSNGRSVSAGVYLVKILVVSGGKTTEYGQKAVTVKPF